jgi:hypothetical protein
MANHDATWKRWSSIVDYIRLDVHHISDENKHFDRMAILYQIKEEKKSTMDGRMI